MRTALKYREMRLLGPDFDRLTGRGTSAALFFSSECPINVGQEPRPLPPI